MCAGKVPTAREVAGATSWAVRVDLLVCAQEAPRRGLLRCLLLVGSDQPLELVVDVPHLFTRARTECCKHGWSRLNFEVPRGR